MTVTASEVFAFLDRHRTGAIERHEISSAYFGVLRRSVRAIATKLSEGDDEDGRDLCERLRVLLSEWLTIPVPFGEAITASLQFLGDPQAVETRWGREVRTEYDTAREAAEIVALDDNPLRVRIREVIRELRTQGQTFRIYCHRRARTHFESIVAAPDDLPLAPECFLSSVVDYREASPFDVLIKVGPLRSRGWGSAPDALLSAPRFARLLQVVWIGCADEEDFGFDPVAAPLAAIGSGADLAPAGVRAAWTSQVIHFGDDRGDTTGAGSVDELKLFQRQGPGAEMRRATLLQIDDEHGILYPPQSQVASFDAGTPGDASIGYRLPGETLGEGMFVLWAFLGDADLGGIQAGDGHYSRIWKERLRDELRRDAAGLVRRLSEAGIALQHLSSRVRRWWRPPSTVIHAPQQRKHFEILIGVLGIDHDAAASSSVFSVLEQARGRSLLELLLATPVANVAKPAAFRAAERHIAGLQLRLMRAKGRAERQRLLDQIFVAEEQLAPLSTELFNRTRTAPRKAATLRDLQRALRTDEVLLEFALAEPNSYVVVATRRAARVHGLAGKTAVHEALEPLLKGIRGGADVSTEARTVGQQTTKQSRLGG